MIKKLLFIVLLFNCFLGIAQTLKYNIKARNNDIGILIVERVIKGNTTTIEAQSDVKIHVFKTIDISYTLKSIYNDNELIYSSVTSYVNGSIHSSCKTTKEGSIYTIHQDGESSDYTKIIDYSAAMMYFKEPINKNKVYSEFNSVIKDIKKVGEHVYELYDPEKGLTNTFYYENGILVKTINPHHFADFELIKI